MRTHVMKWGNSLGVRIPRVYAESVGLRPGTPVEIVAHDAELVIRPLEETLEELLALVTPETVHGEIEWGGPAGRETW